jgi:hypothetical protein
METNRLLKCLPCPWDLILATKRRATPAIKAFARRDSISNSADIQSIGEIQAHAMDK